ncbi:LysE family translocator [Paludibacterium yongneupense]|uniref:LysE family translocator n=1 Tax=Paludibacterium yongneupense TaxID=400061 RepID=UPI0003FF5955|nr:LysE family translocator [Paludibacterium yongneupense]
MPQNAIPVILTIHAFALISPGPDFAVVTRLAIVSGRKTGLWCAAGVAAAIGVYVLLCALGMSLVVSALPGLSKALSVVGALYLAWLGMQCLRSEGKLPDTRTGSQGGKAFVTGFLTNLLNPKAMLYFSSILSQILSPKLGATDIALICGLLLGESLLWFGLVACLFSAPAVLEYLRTRLVWLERSIGVALLILAAKVATLASR